MTVKQYRIHYVNQFGETREVGTYGTDVYSVKAAAEDLLLPAGSRIIRILPSDNFDW